MEQEQSVKVFRIARALTVAVLLPLPARAEYESLEEVAVLWRKWVVLFDIEIDIL